MTYEALLANLVEFTVIVVSGPQRSGTTFTAQCIAEDLGYCYVDEAEFEVNKFDAFMDLITERVRAVAPTYGIVIQAPGLTAKLDHPRLTQLDNVCIVFMRRPLADIIASQDRIQWAHEDVEWGQYGESPEQVSPIAQYKYEQWSRQRERVPNFFEFEYRAMQTHPCWLGLEQRKNFEPKQTRG